MFALHLYEVLVLLRGGLGVGHVDVGEEHGRQLAGILNTKGTSGDTKRRSRVTFKRQKITVRPNVHKVRVVQTEVHLLKGRRTLPMLQ